MSVRDVLLKAADNVENGWIQGTGLQEIAGREYVCLAVALDDANQSVTESVMQSQMCNLVTKAVKAQIMSNSLTEWNDTEGRTQHEVVQMLRDLAEKNLETQC